VKAIDVGAADVKRLSIVIQNIRQLKMQNMSIRIHHAIGGAKLRFLGLAEA